MFALHDDVAPLLGHPASSDSDPPVESDTRESRLSEAQLLQEQYLAGELSAAQPPHQDPLPHHPEPQQNWEVPPQSMPPMQLPEPQPFPQGAAAEYLFREPVDDEPRIPVPPPQQPRTLDPSYQQSQVAEQGFIGGSEEYHGGANLDAPLRMASQQAPHSSELGSISGAMAYMTSVLARGHADPDSPSKHHPMKLSTQAAVRELGEKLTQEAVQDERSHQAPPAASRRQPSISVSRNDARSRHASISQPAPPVASIAPQSRAGTAVDVNKALPPVTPNREVHRRHSMTSTDALGHGRRPVSRASTMKVHQRSATQGSIDMDGRYPRMSTGDDERVAHIL